MIGCLICGCTVGVLEPTAHRSSSKRLGYPISASASTLSARRKFFDNKERLHKLARLTVPEDLELDLDRKMLAVVAKADQPELHNIVRTVFHAMADGDTLNLETLAARVETDREI